MPKSIDEKQLEELLQAQKNEKLGFSLTIEGKEYVLRDASIVKAPTPVNRPTKRGGVYFSDTHVYKIKGTVYDSEIIPLLSKTMLGPNTDFEEILVKAHAENNSKKIDFSLHTNLTNTMQSKSKIELNLMIIRVEKN